MSRFQRRLCAARTLGAPQPRRLRSAGELENRLFTGRARPGAGSPARRWVALPARPGAAGGAHLTRLRRAGRGAAAGRAGARGGLLGCPRPPDPAVRLMSRAGADQPEPLCSGARGLALFLTPEPGSEIRSDTSQILEENIPLLQAKVADMLASAPEWTSWGTCPGRRPRCSSCPRCAGLRTAFLPRPAGSAPAPAAGPACEPGPVSGPPGSGPLRAGGSGFSCFCGH
ncbi:breast carcinoma-amplified sequence 4 isoform X2 [Pipistrellus kuhlii]|uniref:breast carcinoma-amplified sequence 4 isoform X2 n=1 Tax=Pipistrellus kuhlii TaxID=59472 RepID=UPI001E26F99A|nr:breast carcinoma-amplified sequence 4 isoform X2 [Pipistrellus kuhlii]